MVTRWLKIEASASGDDDGPGQRLKSGKSSTTHQHFYQLSLLVVLSQNAVNKTLEFDMDML